MLVEHARAELARIYTDMEDPYVVNLLATIEQFCQYGHSGSSAADAVYLLNKLLQHENLTALTDSPDEWEDRSDISGYPLWQNNRNSKAFSDDAGKTHWYVEDPEYNTYITDAA